MELNAQLAKGICLRAFHVTLNLDAIAVGIVGDVEKMGFKISRILNKH